MLNQLLKVSLVALTALFIALQFSRPAKTNPASDPALSLQAHAQVPNEVSAIFDRACRDCHSNETNWPWYSRIAPVSWLVADDVRIGRQQLNFSEWGRYNTRQVENKLEEICAVVQAGAMPPKKYTLAHPQAKLSDSDVKAVCAWTVAEQGQLTAQD
jgi:cytochrome c5